MGFAWAPGLDGKTVVREIAGFFHAVQTQGSASDNQRAALGTPGLGHYNLAGSSIPNPLPGIPGVPVGKPLDFRGTPTLFTGADHGDFALRPEQPVR
jgi:hypothetical protein